MQTQLYTFNEKRKRLDPTYTLCQFCLKDFSTEMSDNHFTNIYNEKDRTNIVVYRSVKFQKLMIGIPRCKNCKKIHHNSAIYGWLIGFVLAVGVVLLANYFFKYQFGYLMFFSIVGFIATFLLTPPIFVTIFSARQGIFSIMDGPERDPQIQELLHQGWTLNPPSA